MRTILIFIASFSLIWMKADRADPVRWVLSKECSLKVNGSTNINKFSCIIPTYINPDTLYLYKGKVNEQVKITGAMVLDIKYFDCHNGMMTKDLRKTLKATEFPNLVVRFISLSKYPEGAGLIKGTVMITLAGTTRQFDVDYRCMPEGQKGITLIGTKQVNFSDFNIVPPRKIGGMIKTNNLLEVEFVLKANIIN